ncbi:hypothetical protein PBAL39_23697 [Pedobacter sp. BAL39]|uniref:outer membrane beta-barrel protein n=1 Tax=Pedobacter sp. BAL39 TaxID=391596 RepID=UPI0001559433|nr:outer membrane beta-barrel protein [Pedobacter sp. BAL39]EDM36065.1 hypothetical protein PBAL39_23697 [Pedobacter sp. BAL39]
MSNSAWYRKIWQRKLNNLPIKESADSSWTAMQQILDVYIPSTGKSLPTPKTLGSKFINVLTYALPATSILLGITYFLIFHQPQQLKTPAKTALRQQNQKTETTTTTDLPRIEDRLHQEKHVKDQDHTKGQTAAITPTSKVSALQNHSGKIFEQAAEEQRQASSVSGRKSLSVPRDNVDIERNTPQLSIGLNKSKHLQTEETVKENTKSQQAGNKGNETIGDTTHMGNHTTALTNTGLNVLNKQTETEVSEKRNKVKKVKALAAKTSKNHVVKNKKAKKEQLETPKYNYTLELGLSKNASHTGFQIGAIAAYRINTRWIIQSGLRLNTSRSFSGNYTLSSYFRPDSMPAFKFSDTRKLVVADIPLLLEYKLSKAISLKAGPLLSIPLSKSGFKLGTIEKVTDTLMNTKNFMQQLQNTKINSVNIGFSIGTSFHIRQFDINTRYEWLSPYSFSNPLGSFKHDFKIFQIGIGYRFK